MYEQCGYVFDLFLFLSISLCIRFLNCPDLPLKQFSPSEMVTQQHCFNVQIFNLRRCSPSEETTVGREAGR